MKRQQMVHTVTFISMVHTHKHTPTHRHRCNAAMVVVQAGEALNFKPRSSFYKSLQVHRTNFFKRVLSFHGMSICTIYNAGENPIVC